MAPKISTRGAWILILLVFAAVQLASLFTPALLDDVDAAHAQIAQHYLESSDWVTAKTNGIRYIEKPPLPWWIVAVVYRVAGESAFSTHLPNALAMLGLAVLAWVWLRKAWGPRAGLYGALGILTAIGPFLFTRFIIPEAILTLFLLTALYCLITGLEWNRPVRFHGCWVLVALAVLIKGLIAPVFFAGAAGGYLLTTGQWRRWREFKPVSGLLLFLAIAAPWHILAGLANPDQGHPVGNHPTIGNVHGFFYLYFINEHVLRFFGLRYPHDYNKLPFVPYWLLQLVWMFPWSLFLPAMLMQSWRNRRRPADSFASKSALLLGWFAGFVLVFFAISTNLEYYTFLAWIPLLMLIGVFVAGLEEQTAPSRWLTGVHSALAALGVIASLPLFWGLWVSRNLPSSDDIGALLAHRAVAGYTLAMSHLFDLTGPSFAALRLPAAMAAVTFLTGPALAWLLRKRAQHVAATITVALTFALFLIAAHIAFARFEPMLSSKALADTILRKGTSADSLVIIGEQSEASSVIFYTHHLINKPAFLVHPRCGQNGEGSTLLWGSCYPDAPDIFLSDERLANNWGTGERKWLFAEDTNRDRAERILGGRLIAVQTIADKTLWTDRPLP